MMTTFFCHLCHDERINLGVITIISYDISFEVNESNADTKNTRIYLNLSVINTGIYEVDFTVNSV
mgnify:CR=1 FL=1